MEKPGRHHPHQTTKLPLPVKTYMPPDVIYWKELSTTSVSSLPKVCNLNPGKRKHQTNQTEEHSTKDYLVFFKNVNVMKYKETQELFQIKGKRHDNWTPHDFRFSFSIKDVEMSVLISYGCVTNYLTFSGLKQCCISLYFCRLEVSLG